MMFPRLPSLPAACVLLCVPPLLVGSASATVWINEFMASNGGTLADEDGDYEDWIELHNFGDAPVSLQGWGLSDNAGDPFKWDFPEATVIEPGEFLLVWASGKDRVGAEAEEGVEALPPDAVDGLVLRLRAADVEAVDGAAVGVWTDASGRGNNAAQPNVARRPTYVADGLNGRAVLRFNRSATQQFFLPTGGFAGMDDFTDFTYIAVARWTGGVRSGFLGGFRGSNLANAGSAVIEISETGGGFRLRLPPNIDVTASNALSQDRWHVVGAVMDGPQARARLTRDGELLAEATGSVGRTLLSDYERVPVGSSHDDGRTFGGEMAEVLLFNRGLSAEEQAGVERHLKAYYGLGPAPLHPHTNFRIAAAGEELLLTRPDGSTADFVDPVPVPRDVSHGRKPEDPRAWAYFHEPTPGAPNTTPALSSLLAPVEFSHAPGTHGEAFDLTFSHPDPQVTVLYTLDGSEPDIDNLDGTTYRYVNSYPSGPFRQNTFTTGVYSTPIRIADRSGQPDKLARISSTADSSPSYFPTTPVKKGTVVRARAHRDGASGPVTTATYFVSATDAFTWDMPIVSLSVDEDGLFDFFDGIYVAGVDHVTGSGARICNWGNYNRRGREAERAAHIEFFEGGERFLEQVGGIRIQGNCSRMRPFKSLRLYGRSTGLEDGLFDYPFFAETVPGAVHPDNTLHRRLILRTPNFYDTAFSRLFQAVYEGVGGRLVPVKQFINGEYWGLAFLRDRFDPYYLEYHHGLDPDNVTIIDISYRHEFEPIPIRFRDRVHTLSSGIPADMDDFDAMRAFIVDSDMSDPERYAEAHAWICLDSFIDHLILKIFAGDDHYAPEIVYWRARETENEGFGDGRWRFFVKDFDSTLRTGNYLAGLATGTHPRPFGHELFTSLLDSPDFRTRFINRFADLLNTHFRTERFEEIIRRTHEEVAPVWPEVTARWRNAALSNPDRPFTLANRANLLNWAREHPGIQRSHIRSHFLIPQEQPLTVDASDPSGGRVRVNSILIDEDTPGVPPQPHPWTGSYFPGHPVKLTALPREGHRFVEWRVASAVDGDTAIHVDASVVLDVAAATTAQAVFEPLSVAEQPVVIHAWDFEDATALFAPSQTIGGGGLSVVAGPHPDAAAIANTGGDFVTQHLRVNYPLGTTLTLALPTTGYEAITMDFLTRRSGQGAGGLYVELTTDGRNWFPAVTEPDADFRTIFNAPPQSHSFDFAEVADVADNAAFGVRFTFARGEGGEAGNNRFDDIDVRGVALPGTNLPPTVNEGAAPATLSATAGSGAFAVDVSGWFTDPEGDSLSFTAATDVSGVVSAHVEGETVWLTPLRAGGAVLTVSAMDGHNPPVDASVYVLVHPAPHALAEGTYAFGEWSADAPAGAFPANMIFLQSAVDDPDLGTDLPFAYHIPPADAARPRDADFPYAAESRSRVTGLGEDGVAFINTGRGRDLGAALLALDTTGATDINVSFTAGTVLPNSRVYGIRLQARPGDAGPWEDVLCGGDPVEYLRAETEDDVAVMGPVRLPKSLEDRPLVQLQWRYHHIEGGSGPRAMLRLDQIAVSAETLPGAGFASWVAANHPGETDSAVTGPTADPSGHGMPNLLRYAFGLTADETPAPPLIDFVPGPGQSVALGFPRDPAKTDIAYVVETSVDLQDWAEVLYDSRADPAPNNNGDRMRVESPTPPEDQNPRFLRLRVKLIDGP